MYSFGSSISYANIISIPQYQCVLIILIGYIYMYTIMKQGRSLGQGNCIWCECSVRSLSSLGLCGRWEGCGVSFHEQGSDGG